METTAPSVSVILTVWRCPDGGDAAAMRGFLDMFGRCRHHRQVIDRNDHMNMHTSDECGGGSEACLWAEGQSTKVAQPRRTYKSLNTPNREQAISSLCVKLIVFSVTTFKEVTFAQVLIQAVLLILPHAVMLVSATASLNSVFTTQARGPHISWGTITFKGGILIIVEERRLSSSHGSHRHPTLRTTLADTDRQTRRCRYTTMHAPKFWVC